MVKKWIDGYCRLLGYLIAIALALMVVMVFGNVVMRYVFNSGFTVSEELSRWLFVWITFMGGVIALNERSHLGTDTLVSRLPIAGQKACLAIGHLLMLWVCWLMYWGAWEQVKVNLETTSAAMEVSMGFFYASGMVCAVLSAFILLHHLWQLVSGQLTDKELIGIRESEEEPIDIPQPLK